MSTEVKNFILILNAMNKTYLESKYWQRTETRFERTVKLPNAYLKIPDDVTSALIAATPNSNIRLSLSEVLDIAKVQQRTKED